MPYNFDFEVSYANIQSPGGTIYILDSPGASNVQVIDLTRISGDSDADLLGIVHDDMQLVQFQPSGTMPPLQQQHQANTSSLHQVNLQVAFAQAGEMGAAANPTMPSYVELPEDDDVSIINQPQYHYIPLMQILPGGLLVFTGRNGVPLTSSTYNVLFDTSDYFKVPSTDDTYDIGFRNTESDYQTDLSPDEVRANESFVRQMGRDVLRCQMCIGPRGGTHCRSSGFADWQNDEMDHIAPRRRCLAAHNSFLECKRSTCRCHISFRGLVKIGVMIRDHMNGGGHN